MLLNCLTLFSQNAIDKSVILTFMNFLNLNVVNSEKSFFRLGFSHSNFFAVLFLKLIHFFRFIFSNIFFFSLFTLLNVLKNLIFFISISFFIHIFHIFFVRFRTTFKHFSFSRFFNVSAIRMTTQLFVN